MWTNYHSHSSFSDGSNEPEAYVLKALEKGMRAYGFSCHAPIPFEQNWCLRPEKLIPYLHTIRDLKEKYKSQIEIYAGLEIDYIPGKLSVHNFSGLDDMLDYTICSVHYLDYFPDGTACNIDGRPEEFRKGLQSIWNSQAQTAVKRYFSLVQEMLANAAPTIVGHIDKIRMHNKTNPLFDESEDWYLEEAMKTLMVLKKSGSILEINSRGIYKGGFIDPYPSRWWIVEAAKLNIPVTISSDAHRPEEITNKFEEVANLLIHCGYKEQTVMLQGKWQPIPLP
jgi:histidinol-phosphatase (PHP family)